MAKNICIDCVYFLNCKKSCEYIEKCQNFKKANRTIIKIDQKKEE